MSDQSRAANIIAYYLSRFDKVAYEKLSFENITDTHEKVGSLLGVKASTFKNMRDDFDPYFENSRKGWYQRPAAKIRLEVMKELQGFNEEEVFALVQGIVSSAQRHTQSFTFTEMNQISFERRSVIEGELQERKILAYNRNKSIVSQRKTVDEYTCQACGFHYEDAIVECHHLQPIAKHNGEGKKTTLSDLITLCPTCHRLAHYLLKGDLDLVDDQKLLAEIKSVLKRAYRKPR